MSEKIKPIQRAKPAVVVSFSDSVKMGFGLAIGFFLFYSIVLPFLLCGGLAIAAMFGANLGLPAG